MKRILNKRQNHIREEDINEIKEELIKTMDFQFNHLLDYKDTFISQIFKNKYLRENIKIQIQSNVLFGDKELLFKGIINDISDEELKLYINGNTSVIIEDIVFSAKPTVFFMSLFYLSKIEELLDCYKGVFENDVNEFKCSDVSDNFIYLYEGKIDKEYLVNSCKVMIQYEKLEEEKNYKQLIEYLSHKLDNNMKFIDNVSGILIIYSQSNDFKDLLNICNVVRNSGYLKLNDMIYSTELERMKDNRLYIKTDIVTYLDSGLDPLVSLKIQSILNNKKSIYSYKLSNPKLNTIKESYYKNYIENIKEIYEVIPENTAKRYIKFILENKKMYL